MCRRILRCCVNSLFGI